MINKNTLPIYFWEYSNIQIITTIFLFYCFGTFWKIMFSGKYFFDHLNIYFFYCKNKTDNKHKQWSSIFFWFFTIFLMSEWLSKNTRNKTNINYFLFLHTQSCLQDNYKTISRYHFYNSAFGCQYKFEIMKIKIWFMLFMLFMNAEIIKCFFTNIAFCLKHLIV